MTDFKSLDSTQSLEALQGVLSYTFKNTALLEQALTHRSHSSIHNERLEFLGDSVLNCVVASLLFERYSDINEGDLSRVRANLVKQQSLYEIAQRLELSQFLRLGEGELKSGGFRRPSILADTLEALFGAILLDNGFDAAYRVIRALYLPILEIVDPQTLGKDAKTLLQEYLQSKKIALPHYNVVATHGAAHNQVFEVECAVPKLDLQVSGSGGSRRAAEQAAAKLALEAVLIRLAKTPGVAKKRKARTKQLKLDGVAVTQTAPLQAATSQAASSQIAAPASAPAMPPAASMSAASPPAVQTQTAPASPSAKEGKDKESIKDGKDKESAHKETRDKKNKDGVAKEDYEKEPGKEMFKSGALPPLLA